MDAVLLNAAMRVIDWHRDHDLLPSSEVESPPVSERPSTHVPADATSGRDAARPAWPPADSA